MKKMKEKSKVSHTPDQKFFFSGFILFIFVCVCGDLEMQIDYWYHRVQNFISVVIILMMIIIITI